MSTDAQAESMAGMEALARLVAQSRSVSSSPPPPPYKSHYLPLPRLREPLHGAVEWPPPPTTALLQALAARLAQVGARPPGGP